MLVVCPNCASSYGVDMARLRPARGRAPKLRCSRCGFVWQAQLSYAEKVMVVADAVLPVRYAIQVAVQATRSTLAASRGLAAIFAAQLAGAGARTVRAPFPMPVPALMSTPIAVARLRHPAHGWS